MRQLNTLKFLFAVVFFSQLNLYAKDTLNLPQHNFYLSISEIIYKKEIQTFEISIRFFSDDFEKTILNYNNTRIFNVDGEILKSANSSISSYLKKHFYIFDEKGKEIEYEFIGWETEKEVSWCYLEAHHRKFEYLKVKNDFMTEMFRSQKNLVYLKFDKKETSVLLDKKKTIGLLTLE
ncbi:MAG: hypothetical protein L3J74_09195 [Bacteroidales bacterium]|nr:hypothetical protein [Bacteroidales bacterium]